MNIDRPYFCNDFWLFAFPSQVGYSDHQAQFLKILLIDMDTFPYRGNSVHLYVYWRTRGVRQQSDGEKIVIIHDRLL